MSSGPSSDSIAVDHLVDRRPVGHVGRVERGSAAEAPKLGDELGCLVARLRRR